MHSQINIKDLADSCEDYLLHRYIPVYTTDEQSIIDHAVKEGFQIGLYLQKTKTTI